jgi:Mg/Co/Ni transporter MgtE
LAQRQKQERRKEVQTDHPVVRDHIITLDRYPHLTEDQSLHDAVEAIKSYTHSPEARLAYSELFVLDISNHLLVGRARLQDIIRGIDSRFNGLGKVGKFEGKKTDVTNLVTLWGDSFFDECAKSRTKQIREFMSPVQHTVGGSDSLLKALAMMLSANETVLPVVDNDRVAGVIRLEEIFNAITNRCRL